MRRSHVKQEHDVMCLPDTREAHIHTHTHTRMYMNQFPSVGLNGGRDKITDKYPYAVECFSIQQKKNKNKRPTKKS